MKKQLKTLSAITYSGKCRTSPQKLILVVPNYSSLTSTKSKESTVRVRACHSLAVSGGAAFWVCQQTPERILTNHSWSSVPTRSYQLVLNKKTLFCIPSASLHASHRCNMKWNHIIMHAQYHQQNTRCWFLRTQNRALIHSCLQFGDQKGVVSKRPIE